MAQRLSEFVKDRLAANKDQSYWMPARAYLHEPGFSSLYVRLTTRVIFGTKLTPVLDIANVETKVKGKGTFTKLLKRVKKEFPTLPIYVESVLSDRFVAGLERLGFTKVGDSIAPSLFLAAHKELTHGRRTTPRTQRRERKREAAVEVD